MYICEVESMAMYACKVCLMGGRWGGGAGIRVTPGVCITLQYRVYVSCDSLQSILRDITQPGRG